MLKLNMRRGPLRDHSWPAEKSAEATLLVDGWGPPRRWLSLTFVTSPDGVADSRFHGTIQPRHFTDVAQMMVEADLEAAIRAFGKAMENVRIQKRNDERSSDEAA
jgi:hypothetical protein